MEAAGTKLIEKPLTEQVIGAAIEVHRAIGPGLLESAYEECLCHELKIRGVDFERQVPLPVSYKGVKLDCGYRMDVWVERRLVLELKCVEQLLPVHDAQLLTYMRLSSSPVGLLLNFHVSQITRGVRRKVF
jgi:GxxExxY protein